MNISMSFSKCMHWYNPAPSFITLRSTFIPSAIDLCSKPPVPNSSDLLCLLNSAFYRNRTSSILCLALGFPGGSDGKESACNAGDPGSLPWVGKIPWRRELLPPPVFWPGKSHGQRSLAGYSSWGSQRVRHDWMTHFVHLTWWFWDLATLVHVSVAHFFYWSVAFHCLDRAHFVYAATLGDSRLAGSDGKAWVSLLNKLTKCSKADVPDDIPFSHVWDFQFLHILINTWCWWSSWF